MGNAKLSVQDGQRFILKGYHEESLWTMSTAGCWTVVMIPTEKIVYWIDFIVLGDQSSLKGHLTVYYTDWH